MNLMNNIYVKYEYRLDDRCHMIMYRHPPRPNQINKINKNFNQFIFETDEKQVQKRFVQIYTYI